MDRQAPRRGGPNGVWCLGNSEPDGKNWIANWNGSSVGCFTQDGARRMVKTLMDAEFEDAKRRNREGRT